MTRNKLFVAIVAAALMSVALPAGAYHIDHHDGDSGTSVTWVAGTSLIDVCEADRSNATGTPLMGQGGLCFAHNHTTTADPTSPGTATDTTAGVPTETTVLGHHTGLSHDTTSTNHSDHGVFDEPISDDETGATAQDNDTQLDGGNDTAITVSNFGCAQIGMKEWTALNVTIGEGTHQSETFAPAFWFGQISGVQGATTNVTEHLVYHEKTACLVTDGHVTIFIDASESVVFSGDAVGSYTTWGQGDPAPCAPGDRVCATTSGATPS